LSDLRIEKILIDRERRYCRILDIQNIYKKPLLVGRINYPGSSKCTPASEACFAQLKLLLGSTFSCEVVHSELLKDLDGETQILVINDDPINIKKKAVELEESHALGRLFDIDVIDMNGCPVSRTSIGFESRLCLICDQPALECVRAQRHELSDVLAVIYGLTKDI